jgi:hypothetical protein
MRACRGLKEQGNPVSNDLVERPAKRDVPLRAGKTSQPAAIYGRNDSPLVLDQSLIQIRTRRTQISHVFSTGVDPRKIVAQWRIDPTPPEDRN